MPAPIDITGEKYGRLTVLSKSNPYIGPSGKPLTMWECLCDCGTKTIVQAGKIRSGHTQSCGCLFREKTLLAKTHGLRMRGEKTKAYRAWAGLRSRCNDKNNHKYHLYGGRGIKVCERWDHYNLFLDDMGEPPSVRHSIDRIDSNGNYEPGNCRWATPLQQANNLRTTRFYEHGGETASLSEWAEKLGVTRDAIKLRLRRGQTFEQVHSVFTDKAKA